MYVRFSYLQSSLRATQSMQNHHITTIVASWTMSSPGKTFVDVIDIGLSDHRLGRWSMTLITLSELHYVMQQRRLWINLDVQKFMMALQASHLCEVNSYSSELDAGVMVRRYNLTITDIHEPLTTVTCRKSPGSDQRYDADCLAAKRRTRKLERHLKRWRSDYAWAVC